MTIKFNTISDFEAYLEKHHNGFDGFDGFGPEKIETSINEAFLNITAQAVINDIPAFRFLGFGD